jgi:hypothetical protein
VDESEYAKVKLTLLVSDVGQEEEIIGTGSAKVRISELMETGNFITIKEMQITN